MSDQFVRRDRQFANTFAGCVEDGIGDGRRDTHDGELGDALHTQRTHVRIVLFHEDHLHDGWAVSVDWDRIFREVRVRNTSAAGIHHRMLHQRHTDAADHAADTLAASDLRIDDTPGAIGADDASHARLAEIRIDGDFHEHRAEGMHGESLRLVARLHVYQDLDRFSDATHGFGEIADATARERIVARPCARGLHGAAHTRHRHRAAVYRRSGQPRIAESELHALD